MRLTDACIRKPVMAWMLMAMVVLFGLIAWHRIPVSQFPNVDRPVITISVKWEGASPEIVEHDVVEILEEDLSAVESLVTMRSTSRNGSAEIDLEFPMSRNVDLAMQDVQAEVAQQYGELPKDMNPPVVRKNNTDDSPIMYISLSGAFPARVLADMARYQLRDQLKVVPGVSEIYLGSWRERNVRVWIDGARLASRGLTIDEVVGALKRENVELPAGQLKVGGKELNVRVMGEALDLTALRNLVVAVRGGTPVALQEVALVEDGFEDLRSKVRVDGIPAQGIGILKMHDANAIAISAGIRAAIEKIQPTLPPGMELKVSYDGTEFVKESMEELQFEILQAILLTAALCWFFLGSFSSTLNVILAIPMSLLGTIGVLYFMGMSLNTFTLLGLGLAVGLVVDDAIMVLENITRHREAGMDRVRAARIGTREIAFAALASTIAIIAIFSPTLFMDEMIGRFFYEFGVALCLAVLFSYVEAVTLAPARCAQLLNISPRRSLIGRSADGLLDLLTDGYRRVLPFAVYRPILTVFLVASILASSVWLMTRLPTELVPSQDQSRLRLRAEAPVGTEVGETDRLITPVEDYILQQPEVKTIYTFIGSSKNDAGNEGGMYITLVPPSERTMSQAEFQQHLRKEFANYAGMKIQIQDYSTSILTADRGFPVEFTIRGPDWNQLVLLSKEFTTKMAESGLMTEPNTNARIGMPELRIFPDRERCADLGIPIEQVATAIQTSIGGVRAGKFNDQGRRMDIRVRLLADQRARPADLSNILLRTNSGAMVPLTSVIRSEERPTMQSISRQDRERSVKVWANLTPGHSQGEAIDWINQRNSSLPEGYRVVLDGSSANMKNSLISLLIALAFGVLISYMVLAAQFDSYLHPLTVLSVLPPSISGAVFALYISGQSLNAFSVIGILLLMGIAKKNSIILVDYTNQLRKRGEATTAEEALLKAGPIRLRPILMTSGATTMAAIPLALGLGPGGEVRMPMAIAVIGGVVASTLLSLVVVPAFYILSDKLIRLCSRKPVMAPTPVSEAGSAQH